MNIPITKRVMTAGSRKSCGCCGACNCAKSPAKKLTDLSGDGKVTQKDVLIGRGVIDAPVKMYNSPAKKKSCGKKY